MNRRPFLKSLLAGLLAPVVASLPFVKGESVDEKPMTFGGWFFEDNTVIDVYKKTGYSTYYIRADGCDSNCGTDCKRCWKTLQHAASVARPGDTIYISGEFTNR